MRTKAPVLLLALFAALFAWRLMTPPPQAAPPGRELAAPAPAPPLAPPLAAVPKSDKRLREQLFEAGGDDRASGDLADTEPGPDWVWTEEAMLEAAAKRFQFDELDRRRVQANYAPWVAAMDLEAARRELSPSLTEQHLAQLQQVEAPFNSDLEALGQLVADDIELARRDTWVNGLYHVEDAPTGATPRQPLPGESMVAFPTKAFYYRIDSVNYPHLGQHVETRKELLDRRARAIRSYLDGLDG